MKRSAAKLSERNDVFWVGVRGRRTLANDTSIWVGQSDLNAGQTTPVFNHGIYGAGQVAAVLDTGLDADMCFFRDPVLGLPLTNTGSGTGVDPNHRKVLAVYFLWASENPANPRRIGTRRGTAPTSRARSPATTSPIRSFTTRGTATRRGPNS